MNKDYTYCSVSHLCPRKRECKRHISKHPNYPLFWLDPHNKTLDEYLKCEFYENKNQ